jgi:hypothetical protein
MQRREFIAGLGTIAAWLGARAWSLSLALFTLAGLLSGRADACSNPINPTLSRSIIHTALFLREFIVSGCADDVPPYGLPIVFGFHGGGERLHDESGSGFLDFTDLSALHALVIVPVGNVSNNGHSWINAFPWMKPHPENDLLLPAALINWIALRPDLPRADLRRVYALGKSTGPVCPWRWPATVTHVSIWSVWRWSQARISVWSLQRISDVKTMKSVCPNSPFA